MKSLPLADSVAAVSVGVVGGLAVVDLEYEEDVVAEVDMNVVMTGSGKLIEIQATAEAAPFERQVFDTLMGLAEAGIGRINEAQSAVIAQAYFGNGGAIRP
jgi:ribonuclease PH